MEKKSRKLSELAEIARNGVNINNSSFSKKHFCVFYVIRLNSSEFGEDPCIFFSSESQLGKEQTDR